MMTIKIRFLDLPTTSLSQNVRQLKIYIVWIFHTASELPPQKLDVIYGRLLTELSL